MAGSIRCGVAFHSIDEFRAAFIARGPSCFVPYPDEVEPGAVMDIDVTVVEARLELRGTVEAADFDESGSVGLKVMLDEPSWKAVCKFVLEFRDGLASSGIFATTRMRIAPIGGLAPRGVIVTPAQAEPLPTPGDDARAERLEPGTMVDGRFRIEAHLATGGMGEVYRAQHVLLKRPIALKMLRRALSGDAEMWGRFEREAQLVSRLENPHIVRVFDFGRTTDGQLFLAMEFVEGETLEKRVERGPLSPAEAVEILAQVLDGLNEAHGLGVVHRDLKPPNIMLGHRRDGGDRAKILDFGIARLGDALATTSTSKLTQMGVVVGTPAYLAPEQALADELDHRTDIYAMGCVAYELLTGKPPFVGGDLRKVISQHLTSAPVDPAKVRPELAAFPQLCAAVLKALAKEREHRFQNVIDFREALRQALHAPGEPAVPLAELVPEPSAPWPPAAEWQPAPAPSAAPTVAPEAAPVLGGEANDFFTSVGSAVFPGSSGSAAPASSSSRPPAQAAGAPAAVSEKAGEGVFARLEVLGPLPSSAPGQACLARVQEAVTRSGGFVAATDEEGVTFGFIGGGGRPSGRATRAMLAARELVAVESARLRVSATVRGLAASAAFPLAPQVVEKSRRQLASGRANTLWLEQRISAPAARLCELASTEVQGLVACGAPKRRARVTPELISRRPPLEAFERRLTSLQQGVVAPLLVTGPAGSGHTSLANQFVAMARKQKALAQGTTGLPEAFGALVELLCAAVGVHPAERLTRLAAALEQLPIVDSARQSALDLAGVKPLPVLMTAGQAVHALRGVLRTVAAERPMVLVFDGLHTMDEGSVEAFGVMASRPASRELIVGLAAPSPFDAKLTGLQTVALAPLSQADVQRLVSVALGAVAGPALTKYVHAQSDGVPATALQLLAWLDDGGLLTDGEGSVELCEPRLGAPPAGPLRAAIDVMPSDQRLVLQTAAILGARFDQALLKDLLPQVVPQVLPLLQASGWLTSETPKRGRFTSPAARGAVPPLAPAEAQATHLAAAAALIARGTADATSVDHAQLAGHLTAAGDGTRGAPLWKHVLELAVARRDPRGASRAWAGLSAAMGLMPPYEAQARGQVDALARSAAQSLVVEDTARARALLNAVSAQAAALPVPSPEYLLLEARVLRLEGRRVKAVEVLNAAEQAAGGGRVLALVLAERGEAREVEGDLDGASQALEQARRLAPEGAELARWHGEVDLAARLEARLATITFARRDVGKALTLLESSLTKWRAAGWAFAEARVLATMGTVLAYQQRFPDAAAAYQAAALAGARCGDLRFQARALLQQAKAIRKQQGESASMKSVALEAKKLALVLGWEEGRLDATALLGQT
ncbi:MAG: protein kinase [Archangium sp.]|nr:protein kinase [Archangium sp.]